MWDAPPTKMASDGCMGPINYTNPLSTGCNGASCWGIVSPFLVQGNIWVIVNGWLHDLSFRLCIVYSIWSQKVHASVTFAPRICWWACYCHLGNTALIKKQQSINQPTKYAIGRLTCILSSTFAYYYHLW